jgi:hypothetical protein
MRIGRPAPLGRRIVEAGRIGLPDLDQRILERGAGAVDDAPSR